jgi:hypothetical protein
MNSYIAIMLLTMLRAGFQVFTDNSMGCNIECITKGKTTNYKRSERFTANVVTINFVCMYV